MLQLTVPAEVEELWDEVNERFVYKELAKPVTLELEHSLISLSKWESTWCKRYFECEEKTYEESKSYIKCMTIGKNVPDAVYDRIMKNKDLIKQITDYIKAPMTATTFSTYGKETTNGYNTDIKKVSSERIYFWMIEHGIPYQFEKWHLNRLLTLIRVCNMYRSDSKKLSHAEATKRNSQINKMNRARFNSKG